MQANPSNHTHSRRTIIKKSMWGLLLPFVPAGSTSYPADAGTSRRPKQAGQPHEHFPNIHPEVVAEVVGKSHGNLERVKELVDKRPELSRATWEWRFGDWESALGAASHMGRRDIAQYLISKGARPDIFTFAMLGVLPIVKAMIQTMPGIQTTLGPHGISLLRHARAGLRMKDQMSQQEQDEQQRLIDYLEDLGDANGGTYETVPAEEQKKYLGNYMYGEGPTDGFTIQVNMRKLLSIGPINGFGGSMLKIGDNKFMYDGSPSVTFTFDVQNGIVRSLTVHEPDLQLTAYKVS